MLHIDEEKIEELTRDIASALNKNSVDTDLATPDFILAEHVIECLQAYGKTLTNRKAWFLNQLDEGTPLRVRSVIEETLTGSPDGSVPFIESDVVEG